ncbi:unnamed protein product, partial [Prorocentrum cordatum]
IVKLTYLDAKSSGEPIRLALHVACVAFEDVRASYDEVNRLRGSGYLPFGQVPALEVDGQVFAQSQAILRWVGRQTGLYPDDLQIQIDQVDEALVDLRSVLRPGWYGSVLGRHPLTGKPLLELTPGQRAEVIELLNTVVLPARLAQLEQLLTMTSPGPLVCGGRLTIADLSLYVYASGLLDGTGVPAGVSSQLLEACPRILAQVRHVEALPAVAEWNRLAAAPQGAR